jgi:hypothetical protein
MSDAFNFAWTVLKADLSQQLLAPEMVSRTGGGLAFSPYAESAERFMPQGAMHPAIGGMMERQGIQQPMPGQETSNPYQTTTNPVERQRTGSDLEHHMFFNRMKAPTFTGPTFHGENQNYYGQMGENTANALAQMLDPSLTQGSASYPTTGSALPVGVTPYENVMQAM